MGAYLRKGLKVGYASKDEHEVAFELHVLFASADGKKAASLSPSPSPLRRERHSRVTRSLMATHSSAEVSRLQFRRVDGGADC